MGQRVALKYAHTAYEAASLTREQKVYEKAGQHPNCQPLLDVIEKQGFGVMSVVPLYTRGSLLEKAEMIRPHPKEEYMPFYIVSSLVRDFQQVAAGLVHLHAHNIVHGDIKEGNILLRDDYASFYFPTGAVLANYGLSVEAGTEVSGFQGSLPYLAPEVLDIHLRALEKGEWPSYKAKPEQDVWSIAAAFFAALSPNPIRCRISLDDVEEGLADKYKAMSPDDQAYADCLLQIERRYYHLDLERWGVRCAGLRPHPEDWFTRELIKILQQCLQERPEARIAAFALHTQLQALICRLEEAEQAAEQAARAAAQAAQRPRLRVRRHCESTRRPASSASQTSLEGGQRCASMASASFSVDSLSCKSPVLGHGNRYTNLAIPEFTDGVQTSMTSCESEDCASYQPLAKYDEGGTAAFGHDATERGPLSPAYEEPGLNMRFFAGEDEHCNSIMRRSASSGFSPQQSLGALSGALSGGSSVWGCPSPRGKLRQRRAARTARSVRKERRQAGKVGLSQVGLSAREGLAWNRVPVGAACWEEGQRKRGRSSSPGWSEDNFRKRYGVEVASCGSEECTCSASHVFNEDVAAAASAAAGTTRFGLFARRVSRHMKRTPLCVLKAAITVFKPARPFPACINQPLAYPLSHPVIFDLQ